MSFLETVVRAKRYLREQGRVSLRGLEREFGLDRDTLEALLAELVDVQQVAAREGKVLSWIGAAPETAPAETTALPSPPAPPVVEGELRQLTVLFCDLVESTQLASQMDPEEWGEVLGSYQATAYRVVTRFGGHVAQYLGDGLLVYFGYPQAHEDAPERAVRAGLGIVQAVAESGDALEARHGIRLAVRVGIHTGPVVMSRMGSGASGEKLAMGETTNVASRLLGEAEPGSVVLSAATLRLVQGIFVTRDLGPRNLKGVPEPMRVHQALRASGVRSRLDAAAAEGLTPLVGRDPELGVLLGRWEQVQDGFGQVVILSGEAGIGKSRLVQELRERMAETPHTWLECHASSFTRDSAFHSIIDLLRHGLRLAEDEPPEEKLAKLTAVLEQNDMPLEVNLPVLASLLSLPLPEGVSPPGGTPERLKRLTREALLEWLLRLGRLQPLVLVMEDLHWMDPSTLELVEMVVDRAPTASVLVLLTHRPAFEPPWAARGHVLPISVGRLSPRQAAAVVDAVAGVRRLPTELVNAIVERADGVPLFVEELTRALLESDLERKAGEAESAPFAPTVPATLQDSLTARLDRLGSVKELAQLASTVGREFPYELLRAVFPSDEHALQRGLERLIEAGLIYPRGEGPRASYVFRHALVQEAAYQSLLRTHRQHFHRRIAEALEQAFAENVEGQPEWLAHHFARAGLAERAIPYWQKAGQRAIQRSANVEAVRHLRQGLAALEQVPAGPARDGQELGMRTLLGMGLIATEGYSAPQVLRNFARARDVCEALGDTPALLPVLLGLFRFYLLRSDREATAQLVAQCQGLAESTREPAAVFFARLAAGLRAFYAGEHERGRELLAEAWSLYDPAQRDAYTLAYGQDPGVSAQMHTGWNEWYLGFPDRARDIVRRALEHSDRAGQSLARAGGLVSASRLFRLRGEGEAALRYAEASIEISREQGFSTWLWAGLLCRGTALGLLGHVGEAISQVRDATRTARSIGSALFVPHACCELASLYLEAGEPAQALRALDEALELVETNLDVYEQSEIHRLRGEALLRSADPAAEDCLRRALDISRERSAKSLELRAATSLARQWQRQGRRSEARGLLEPVHARFSEGFGTRDLKQAKALLDGLA
jgi:class 3 adenylate cyclase/predicted ATPase